MSVTHADFAQFASALVSSTTEIDQRNSASRAYYAAFHLSHSIMDRCPSNDHLAMGSHERITDRLNRQGSIDAKSLQYILLGMKKIRHTADYEISDNFPNTEAQAQLSQYGVFERKVALFSAKFSASTSTGTTP